jgi:hypothetical protein
VGEGSDEEDKVSPVTIEERYKHMFAQLQFASEIRFKILAGWGAVYLALAAAFAWTQESSPMKPFTWVVPLLGFGATILFWFGDIRNRKAIGAAKTAGAAIEADPASEIPENQRYFSGLNRGVRHGMLIDVFAIVMLVLLVLAAALVRYGRDGH